MELVYQVPYLLLDRATRSTTLLRGETGHAIRPRTSALLYPSAMMGESVVEGDVPDPPWVDPRLGAREPLDPEGQRDAGRRARGHASGPGPRPRIPRTWASTLTPEERLILIRMADLGAQYYSRRNVEGAEQWRLDGRRSTEHEQAHRQRDPHAARSAVAVRAVRAVRACTPTRRTRRTWSTTASRASSAPARRRRRRERMMNAIRSALADGADRDARVRRARRVPRVHPAARDQAARERRRARCARWRRGGCAAGRSATAARAVKHARGADRGRRRGAARRAAEALGEFMDVSGAAGADAGRDARTHEPRCGSPACARSAG